MKRIGRREADSEVSEQIPFVFSGPTLRFHLTLCTLWLLLPLSATSQSLLPPHTQILTAEEIQQAGVVRWSDLFALIDAWYPSSLEGFTYDVSANGLAAPQENEWHVFVDGQPIDLRLLDGIHINMLPLTLDAISYIEVINAPTIIAGRDVWGGALHVHTRQPEAGLAVRGSFGASNETGDPGPFRYTPFRTPNIDRIGPTLEGMASVAGAAGHLRVHTRFDEHHATDERIRQRVRTIYVQEGEPRLFQATIGADAATTGRIGMHRLFAGLTRLQDLAFTEPLGFEVPRDQYLYQAGLHGDFFPGQASGLNYHFAYTRSRFDLRANRGSFSFAWQQDHLQAASEARFGTGPMYGALGAGGTWTRSTTAFQLDDERLPVPKVYARLGMRSSSASIQAEVSGSGHKVKGRLGGNATARLRLSDARTHLLHLQTTVARRPYAGRNTPWYWVARGYAFYDQHGADLELPSEFPDVSSVAADAAWTIRPSDLIGLTVGGSYRRFTSLTLADYDYIYDPSTTGFTTQTRIRTYLTGEVTRASAELHLQVVPSLDQRLYVAYLRYPSESLTYFEAWSRLPWQRFKYTVRFVPVERLSLYGRLSYGSSTLWPAYFAAAEASGGRYDADIPGMWLLDLSMQKLLWKDHLRINLSLSNFLNEDARRHPAGAITHMVFTVRMRLYLSAPGS